MCWGCCRKEAGSGKRLRQLSTPAWWKDLKAVYGQWGRWWGWENLERLWGMRVKLRWSSGAFFRCLQNSNKCCLSFGKLSPLSQPQSRGGGEGRNLLFMQHRLLLQTTLVPFGIGKAVGSATAGYCLLCCTASWPCLSWMIPPKGQGSSLLRQFTSCLSSFTHWDRLQWCLLRLPYACRHILYSLYF